MIRKAFLLAISLLALTAAAPCPDDYTPASFEEAEEALSDLLEEYFDDRNLSLPPTPRQRGSLGLKPVDARRWRVPDALRRSGRRLYPVRQGIWEIEWFGKGGPTILHLLIREPRKLSETEAFNRYNELTGEGFADYDNPAYVMILRPEEIRRRWKGHYLGIGVRLYGVIDDATGLERTYGEIRVTDYTPYVRRYQACGEQQ